MNRLFWLMAGMILGAAMYRYFREQGGEIPGFETLGEQSHRLQERGREFAESGRRFADSGRQLADESRQFGQVAMETARMRGREMVENVRSQASSLQGTDMGEMAQDIGREAGEAARESASSVQRHTRASRERLREDVRHDGSTDTEGA